MSKTVKRKITVELRKPRDLSKNRLSVFQRLGTKKSKSNSISESKSITEDLKQTLSAAVTITTKPILSHLKVADLSGLTASTSSASGIAGAVTASTVELEDADPDILEKKREEIQKELELQLKMESRKAKEAALRKRKHQARSSSSSSSSSSDSDSSSSSSTSSSSDDRHRHRLKSSKRRDSSSSSDDLHAKKMMKKRLCAKKEAHKSSKGHSKKSSSIKTKKRSPSESSSMKRQRVSAGSSSSTVVINSKGQKVVMKTSKLLSVEKHRLREKEKEHERERERERERLRLREKERIRSRSPKMHPKSRSPKRLSDARECKTRTPPPISSSSRGRLSPSKSSRYGSGGSSTRLDRRMDSRERERRDKERQDKDTAREKERREALARCQERQRERERLAKDKGHRLLDEEKDNRLLPHPAERAAMTLAAARGRSRDSDVRRPGPSPRVEKDHLDSYGRAYEERGYSGSRRHDGDIREGEYDGRRDEKYDTHVSRRDDRRGNYAYEDESNVRGSERGDWPHHEIGSSATPRDNYERHQPSARDWDRHGDVANRENYVSSRDWNDSGAKWENRKPSNWQSNETEDWNRYDENWSEAHGKGAPIVHDKTSDLTMTGGPGSASSSTMTGKGIVSRRWNSWRGRGARGTHHGGDFRRPGHHHHVTEIYEERGEVYRRHINPQGTKVNEAATTTPTTSADIKIEKPISDEKPLANEDGEEIADDLSEFSDEVDELFEQNDEQVNSPKKEQLIVDAEPPIDESIADEKSNAIEETTQDSEVNKEEKAVTSDQATKIDENSRTKDLIDDIDLDFEEISDGELEEEAKIKGLGDALGVDWASLVAESKAIAQQKSSQIETSARERWQTHHILLNVGISHKMAGRRFAEGVLVEAQQKFDAEKRAKMKQNDDMDTTDDKKTIVKIEIDENDEKIETKISNNIEKTESIKGIACAQVAARVTINQQKNVVFGATGPYSRGLSAQRDIAMRRMLCQLPLNETNCKISTLRQRTGYENIATELFLKSLAN